MLHYLNYGGHFIICNDTFKQKLDKEFFKLLKKEFMNDFKQFRRKQITELREVTLHEVEYGLEDSTISISQVDLDNGSPKFGDMIARNPKKS